MRDKVLVTSKSFENSNLDPALDLLIARLKESGYAIKILGIKDLAHWTIKSQNYYPSEVKLTTMMTNDEAEEDETVLEWLLNNIESLITDALATTSLVNVDNAYITIREELTRQYYTEQVLLSSTVSVMLA